MEVRRGSHFHNPAAATQNCGNVLGSRPSVRISQFYLRDNSGDAIKAIIEHQEPDAPAQQSQPIQIVDPGGSGFCRRGEESRGADYSAVASSAPMAVWNTDTPNSAHATSQWQHPIVRPNSQPQYLRDCPLDQFSEARNHHHLYSGSELHNDDPIVRPNSEEHSRDLCFDHEARYCDDSEPYHTPMDYKLHSGESDRSKYDWYPQTPFNMPHSNLNSEKPTVGCHSNTKTRGNGGDISLSLRTPNQYLGTQAQRMLYEDDNIGSAALTPPPSARHKMRNLHGNGDIICWSTVG